MVPKTTEPYADTQAAYFIEGGGAVYALVGLLVKNVGEDGQTQHHLLVGEDTVHPVDERLVPLFEWFTTPRYENQVAEWLNWADAPSGFLEIIIGNGLLVSIDTANPQRAAKSLRGIRLVPLSLPDLDSPTGEGFVAIKRSEDSRADTSTSVELGEVLWGDHPRIDVPSAVSYIAGLAKMNFATAARRTLTDVPMLLEYGFIRLEWVNGRAA